MKSDFADAVKRILPAVLLGLAACGAPEGDGSAPPVSAAREANAGEPAAVPKAAATPIMLAPEGIDIPGTGTIRFGAPVEETIAALSKALGKPPTERGANEECGGGPMTYAQWDGGFYVWFSEDKLAGWDDRGTYKTAGGIGIGSRRADIARLPGLTIEDSSLGTEFASGSLGGLLASEAADAKVTALWGGYACAIR